MTQRTHSPTYPTRAQLKTLAILTLFIAGGGQQALAEVSTGSTATPQDTPISPSDSTSQLKAEAEAASYDVLSEQFLAKEGVETDLTTRTVKLGRTGWSHTRFQQTYNGIPVLFGEAIVHLKADGSFGSLTDALVPDLKLNTEPTLTPQQAAAIATDELGMETGSGLVSDPALYVFPFQGEAHLIWEVRLTLMNTEQPSLPILFVDAHTGEVLDSYDNLSWGTGQGYYVPSSTTISTYSYGGSYYLQDNTRKICTTNLNGGTTIFQNLTDANDVWGGVSSGTNDAQTFGVDVQYYAAKTYDYFSNTWGWVGLDGNASNSQDLKHTGANSQACARLGVNAGASKTHSYINNAAWDPSVESIKFGYADDDGNGNRWNEITMVDVVAHEWTHGIVFYSAGLANYRESFAINESVADVFGAVVENYATGSTDWLVADEVKPDKDNPTIFQPLRSMLEPEDYGHPDHYSEIDPTLSADPHSNAGIGNKAFTLLALGGTHLDTGSMTGIGLGDATEIWWETLTNYMTTYTSYTGLRNATVLAAGDLFGNASVKRARTIQAWNLVGVVGIGTISTEAGTGTAGTGTNGVPATDSTLNTPAGIATDGLGNIYVADSANHKVRKILPSGIITAFAGTGVAGWTNDGNLATLAKLNTPTDVAVSCFDSDCSTFTVYIADTNNHLVRSVDEYGIIDTVAGDGTAGYNDDTRALLTHLNYPRGIAAIPFHGTDLSNPDYKHLYIADTVNNRVRYLEAEDSPTIHDFAGTGTAGFSGDGGAPSSAKLNQPRGVETIGADVYISDSSNHRIRKVSGTTITTYAGTGVAGFSGDWGSPTSAKLNNPAHLSYFAEQDASGIVEEHLFIADQSNHRIRHILMTGGTIETSAGNGTAGYSGDGGLASAAKLNSPLGVAADWYGGILIGDTSNHVIRKVWK